MDVGRVTVGVHGKDFREGKITGKQQKMLYERNCPIKLVQMATCL
jgi:hypothetical protein